MTGCTSPVVADMLATPTCGHAEVGMRDAQCKKQTAIRKRLF